MLPSQFAHWVQNEGFFLKITDTVLLDRGGEKVAGLPQQMLSHKWACQSNKLLAGGNVVAKGNVVISIDY